MKKSQLIDLVKEQLRGWSPQVGDTKGLTPKTLNKILMKIASGEDWEPDSEVGKKLKEAFSQLEEERPGLWANIRAKRARGEKPAHKNSKAHKDAVKAGKKINAMSNEATEESYYELQNIMDQLYELSDQAKQIMRSEYPEAFKRGEAYGAFDFGTSSNSYDTTFEKILDNIQSGDDLDEEQINEDKSDAIRWFGNLKYYYQKGLTSPDLRDPADKEIYKRLAKDFFSKL